MAITASQNELLTRLQTSYANGLTTGEASQRRRDETIGGLNNVNPPINCPKESPRQYLYLIVFANHTY